MGSGRPIAVIEAKALGKPLDEKETMQALNYANTAGIPYMTLTNGDHWRMLEVFKQAPMKDRILMNFQLTQDEPYACALQALGLWRPNLASGKPQEAATPVMIEKPARVEPAPTTSELSREKKVSEPSSTGDWKPLTSLSEKRGQKAPAFIRFSNSSPKPIKNWADLLESAAEYLVEIGKLSALDCPVIKGRSKLFLLHTKSIHPNDNEFVNKRKIGKLWLNTHFNSTDTWKNACWLLENFGVNPSNVLVSTNPS